MTLNDPELTRLIARLHDRYEQALAKNDVEALGAFFWDSPHVVRYGVGEELYGSVQLRAYRQGHTPPYSSRRVVRREICTFGGSTATVVAEVEMIVGGGPRRSRQSQVWVQLPDVGWRIVSAHVSVPSAASDSPWGAYVDAMARTLELPLGAHRPGVVANLERTAAIAAPLLALSLPDEADPAPLFIA